MTISSVEELGEICRKLEQQELEAQLSGGRPGKDLFPELLAGYIGMSRLPEAKFLWKRIPDTVKQETKELGKIWDVGKSIWTRDNPKVFQNLQSEWSEPVQPLMEFIGKKYREDMIKLVSMAYSSIRLADLCGYLGLDHQETVKLAQSLSWMCNRDTEMVEPIPSKTDGYKREGLNNQLQGVADFISYLEN